MKILPPTGILPVLLLLAIPGWTRAQHSTPTAHIVHPRISELTLRVGGSDADVPGFTNLSIQMAIDALEGRGGKVMLDPGIFEITTPVRLKSGIHLQGAGTETILRRSPGVQTRFIEDADYGELRLTVEDPGGFSMGMKVQVSDTDNHTCWDVSTARITQIEDDVIYLDRGLIRNYRSDREGLLSNASSVIEVIQAEKVLISDLLVDGNRAENFMADGCNSAGIFILRSSHVTLDRVRVRDFNGEGISWQITEHVSIRNSEVSGSGNTGLHPGTGSPFTTIENNDIHHNDRDGLFVCWRVYQSKVTGNRFHHNGRYGICTGHKDTDVLFEDNHIHHNGRDGVNLRPERAGNAPHRNTFENNGAGEPAYGFSINSPAEELLLEDNTFLNASGSQKGAIMVYKNGLKPQLKNNHFDPHEQGEVIVEDR